MSSFRFLLLFAVHVFLASLISKASALEALKYKPSIHDSWDAPATINSHHTNTFHNGSTVQFSNHHFIWDPNHKQKRTISGSQMTQCPFLPTYSPFVYFDRSMCEPNLGPQFFRMRCKYFNNDDDPDSAANLNIPLFHWYVFHYVCDTDYYCVQAYTEHGLRPTAWCVRETTMRQIRNRELGGRLHVSERFFLTDAVRERRLFGVALTLPTGSQSAIADSLTIAAQSEKSLFNAVSYTSLDEGLGACTQCASIALDAIPKGVQSILVKAVLPFGITSVNLYLANVGE
ncbi:hypothetical protein MMC20_006828 [Loxospora ochrophaea]|nr:hypothetical protein [Loxospora ochrophaea]